MKPPRAGLRRLRLASLAQPSATLASQGLSTASTMLLAILVAHQLAPGRYGAWALLTTLYALVLQVSRAAASTPVMIDHGHQDRVADKQVRGALSTAALIGLGGSAVGLIAAVLVPLSPTESLWLPLLLPALLIQDGLRQIAFTEQRGHIAATLDATWVAGQALGYAALFTFDWASAATISWVWGLAALPGPTVLLARRHLWPSVRAGVDFVKQRRAEIVPLVLESLLGTGMLQLVPVLLALVAGYGVVAGMRGSQTLFGAITLMNLGLTPLLTVAAVRRARAGRNPAAMAWLGTSVTVATAAMVLVAVHAFPGLGLLLTGQSWPLVATILLPSTLAAALRGPWFSVPIILRARRQLTRLVRFRIACLVPATASPVIGATLYGLSGAAWGTVVAGAINAVIAAWFLWRSNPRRTPATTHSSDHPGPDSLGSDLVHQDE